MRGPSNLEVNNDRKKTNPDVNVMGGDENYLEINGFKIAYGRNITQVEVESGRSICFLGSAVAKKLYPDFYDENGNRKKNRH